MAVLKSIFKWAAIILLIFSVQTVTFLTLGPSKLQTKLLPENLSEHNPRSDSLFIRDYYTSDCYSGETYSYQHSLNLQNQSEYLKEKFDVKFIHFSEKKIAYFLEEIPRYNLQYFVNARSKSWITLFGFYDCAVDEALHVKHNSLYREANYSWILFFWIKTYDSTSLVIR